MKDLNKRVKGEWGYISYQRKRVLLITLVLYVCAIGIYLFGYFSLNTPKNMFTIIAVLSILPASKSMVNLIMFLRFRSLPADIHKSYSEHAGDMCIIYEMPFTTYEKTYYVEASVCKNKTLICSYPPGNSGNKGSGVNGTQDIKKLTEHLIGVIGNEGYKDITVKVYGKREDFIKRTDELSDLKAQDIKADRSVLDTLLSVVL